MSAILRDQITAAGTAHTNSTDEGSLASKAFAAGTLTPGKVYLITGSARVTSSNSTDTVTMRLRWGTSATVTSNTAVGTTAAIDSANDDVMSFVATLSVQTTTRAVISGVITSCDALAVTGLAHQVAAVLTIDQATAYRLDLTADWSVAHADNDIQAESFDVIEIA